MSNTTKMIIGAVVVIAIGFAGYKMYQKNQNKTK